MLGHVAMAGHGNLCAGHATTGNHAKYMEVQYLGNSVVHSDVGAILDAVGSAPSLIPRHVARSNRLDPSQYALSNRTSNPMGNGIVDKITCPPLLQGEQARGTADHLRGTPLQARRRAHLPRGTAIINTSMRAATIRLQ